MEALALLRMGMTASTVICFVRFLFAARYYVLLDGKESERCYQHSSTTLIMKSGQVTGWSQPILFLIAKIITVALTAYQPGITLVSPTGKETYQRYIEMYLENFRQVVNKHGVQE